MSQSSYERQRRLKESKVLSDLDYVSIINSLKERIKKMQMKMFSIYDAKAEAYLQPFYMRNRAEAIRALTGHVSNSEHSFCKHANDYTLFEIASWDEEAGVVTPLPVKLSVIGLWEIKGVSDVIPSS